MMVEQKETRSPRLKSQFAFTMVKGNKSKTISVVILLWFMLFDKTVESFYKSHESQQNKYLVLRLIKIHYLPVYKVYSGGIGFTGSV